MKIRILFVVLLSSLAFLRAELKDSTEHLDRGKKGRAEKLIISRDGATIYERFSQDRDLDGKFENYIETFTVGGKKVLQFTFVAGSRGTIFHEDAGAQVILSSEKDSWRPDGVFIELGDKQFEMFTLQPDGFFRPVDDDEKKRIMGIVKATDE